MSEQWGKVIDLTRNCHILETQLMIAKQQNDDLKAENVRLEDKFIFVRDQRECLRAKLDKYGRHSGECDINDGYTFSRCTCGFKQDLSDSEAK